jgi:hypothetical protein
MSTTAPLSALLILALAAAACDRKKPFGIEYRESTHEESVAAATAAFAGRGEAMAAEPEIEDFFARMARASREPGPVDGEAFISVEAMLETAEAAGILDGLGAAQKNSFRSGFQRGFRKGAGNLGQALRQMAFDRHRIARLEQPAENRRIVFVSLYDNELNVSSQMRWWLVRTDAGWRAHDFEDLSVGLSTVGLMGTMMKAGIGKSPEPWIADFVKVVNLMREVDVSDPAAAAGLHEPLAGLMGHELPPGIRRFAGTMLVSACMAGDKLDEAEQQLRAAREGGYHSPLADYQQGHLHMLREQWREALAAFDQHIAAMGADCDILESVSDCHYHLGDMAAARAAALRGLDDNPQAVNCLASLVAASTPEQLGEPALGARFEASGDPATAYEAALDYLVSLEAWDKANALFAACRDRLGDPDLVEYYRDTLAEEN